MTMRVVCVTMVALLTAAGATRAAAQGTVPVQAPVQAPTPAQVPASAPVPAPTFADQVVVTGRRVETPVAETPQTIEVITSKDVERSAAVDLTDLLKKNAGVDVVQYNGVLSGIGIRGFRPETSGINKRSLLLIDGRPSGVTNLATMRLDSIDHIEVLKGPASAVYGSSAMGGVVNVITKRSKGPLRASGNAALGSFTTGELTGAMGGSLSRRIDLDLSGGVYDRHGDYRMGNGVTRPATTFRTYDGAARLGMDLTPAWRIEGHASLYRGRDINSPGDVTSGVSSQGRKNLEQSSSDVGVSGRLGAHALSATAFHASEAGHINNITTTDPLDQPFLPYLTFESHNAWNGAQVKDGWHWSSASDLVVGLDYERVTSDSRSHARTGDRKSPFSADNRKDTVGIYAENTLRLFDGGTIVSFGGRMDRIRVRTLDTPLKSNFTPSLTSFTVFNPSAGITQRLVGDLRAHATVGRAFVPADAGALTGFTTTVIGGRTQINQGNPDLKPERSLSFDAGVAYLAPLTHVDVTYFQTRVTDRVVSNVLQSNPAPPDPIVLTSVNALAAHIKGVDLDLIHRLTPRFSAFSTITHYLTRTEELRSSGERNILNVPSSTVRIGTDVDLGRLSGRVALRYVRGRQDQDFTLPGSPVVDYTNFAVIDLNATYRVRPRHAILINVDNLFDTFYYEKRGYPLAGTAVTVRYRIGE